MHMRCVGHTVRVLRAVDGTSRGTECGNAKRPLAKAERCSVLHQVFCLSVPINRSCRSYCQETLAGPGGCL